MKKFDLIKAAHANFIHLPPPEHVLVNDEAQKRLEASGIVFAGRYTANGAGSGFGMTGAKAIQELAAMLWRENPKYHLGTESGRFLRAVLNAVVADFLARGVDPIESGQDAILEGEIYAWFGRETYEREFFVPCSILPDHATGFRVGPVSFLSDRDFLVQEGLDQSWSVHSSTMFGPLLDAMRERSARWLAQVKTNGRDKELAAETADLAVDIALVAVQIAMPLSYSRSVARITGRTFPAWTGQVSKGGGSITSGVTRQDPGHGFSAQVFDVVMSQGATLLSSIGNRVNAFVTRECRYPRLEQGWADAAYWLHEGLAEPLESVATAKLETATEVLLGAGSTKGSRSRLIDAFDAFYGLARTDLINPQSSLTVGKFVEQIVNARSRILHGTLSTLSKTGTVENAHSLRGATEAFAMHLLSQSSVLLDGYGQQCSASKDDVTSFLAWIKATRNAPSGA